MSYAYQSKKIDINHVRTFHQILRGLPIGAITETVAEDDGITFFFDDSAGSWYVHLGPDGVEEKRL